jgi:hypothetical protein
LNDLFSVREVDGRYEVLVMIEDPGHLETWEPLATHIVQSMALQKPDGEIIPIPLGDALRAEGWICLNDEEREAILAWHSAFSGEGYDDDFSASLAARLSI